MSRKAKLMLFLAVVTAVLAVPAMALAEDSAANKYDSSKWLAGAAGFAIGIAALGGTLGQGRAASAALEGISRNPGAAARIQTPMILGLAFIESLVLFTWLMCFFLQGKI